MLFEITGVDAGGLRNTLQVDAADSEAAGQVARDKGWQHVAVAAVEPAQAAPQPLSYLPVGRGGMPFRTRWTVVLILLGTEAFCLMAGSIVFALSNPGSDKAQTLLTFAITGVIFLTLQIGILMPVLRPQAADGRPKPLWMWLGAIAIGVLLGATLLTALALAADLAWAEDQRITNEQLSSMGIIAIITAIIFWLISAPLVVLFMRRGRPESTLAKLSAAIFLGSVVEFIGAIPIIRLVGRRDSCTCAHASFWSMILATMTATLVLGPMVLLIILARRTRMTSRGYCAACGCDLRPLVNKDRCPQCGAGWKVRSA